MKKYILLAFLAFSVWNLNSAQAQSSEARNLGTFTHVASGGPVEVQISLGNKHEVRFSGDADAIATLVTEVKGSSLIIRPEVSWKSWNRKYEGKKIVAHVVLRSLSGLTLSGNGHMQVNNPVKSNDFAITMSGSGSMKLDLQSNALTSTISGSGNLNINGSAQSTSTTISGSGSFSGQNFKTEDLDVVISGSGKIYIQASQEISAVISGSGIVRYKGNPQISKTIIGSGSIARF